MSPTSASLVDLMQDASDMAAPAVWAVRIAVTCITTCIYFIPAHIACGNGKRNQRAIFALNFFLG